MHLGFLRLLRARPLSTIRSAPAALIERVIPPVEKSAARPAPARTYLDFEKPIADLESKVADLRTLEGGETVSIAEEIRKLLAGTKDIPPMRLARIQLTLVDDKKALEEERRQLHDARERLADPSGYFQPWVAALEWLNQGPYFLREGTPEEQREIVQRVTFNMVLREK